jgi:polyhydroxybutyrate depolymerase
MKSTKRTEVHWVYWAALSALCGAVACSSELDSPAQGGSTVPVPNDVPGTRNPVTPGTPAGAAGSGSAPTVTNPMMPAPIAPAAMMPAAMPAPAAPAMMSEGPAQTPAVDCSGKETLAAGIMRQSVMHDGVTYEYEMQIPDTYDGTKAVPLVLDFHGLGSDCCNERGHQSYSGWRAKAKKEGFIVVQPQGPGQQWTGGSCCGGNRDDVGFSKTLVETVSEQACINPKLVFATGLSNGGAMSHHLACNAADVFAGTAPVSMGYSDSLPCMPPRPITVVMFRGTNDTTVSYNGGGFRSADADFEAWSEINGCTGEPELTLDGNCRTRSMCEGGVQVTACKAAVGHGYYGQEGSTNVSEIAYDIFMKHPLP